MLTFEITGSSGETVDNGSMIRRIDRTLDNLRPLPGVEGAATATMLPGVPSLYQLQFSVDGDDPSSIQQQGTQATLRRHVIDMFL